MTALIHDAPFAARPRNHETPRPRSRETAQPRFDVHAISVPARTFTGDFWFTHRTDDRLWFALGDVAGKGLPAALVMAMIQEELEHRIASCARAGCDPATTMQRLHAFLKPLLPSNRFATAVIGWLRDDGALTLVNAGHCPPILLRSDGADRGDRCHRPRRRHRSVLALELDDAQPRARRPRHSLQRRHHRGRLA